jgi:hypothetical protein
MLIRLPITENGNCYHFKCRHKPREAVRMEDPHVRLRRCAARWLDSNIGLAMRAFAKQKYIAVVRRGRPREWLSYRSMPERQSIVHVDTELTEQEATFRKEPAKRASCV